MRVSSDAPTWVTESRQQQVWAGGYCTPRGNSHSASGFSSLSLNCHKTVKLPPSLLPVMWSTASFRASVKISDWFNLSYFHFTHERLETSPFVIRTAPCWARLPPLLPWVLNGFLKQLFSSGVWKRQQLDSFCSLAHIRTAGFLFAWPAMTIFLLMSHPVTFHSDTLEHLFFLHFSMHVEQELVGEHTAGVLAPLTRNKPHQNGNGGSDGYRWENWNQFKQESCNRLPVGCSKVGSGQEFKVRFPLETTTQHAVFPTLRVLF